jgi:glycogen operon protein
MELVFFEHEDDAQPARVVVMNPDKNPTYHYCHVFVSDVKAGQLYAYRAYGPFVPGTGMRFDSSKVLIDPYGRGVRRTGPHAALAAARRGTAGAACRRKPGFDFVAQ